MHEFPTLRAMQRQIPLGWFFAVFELNDQSSCSDKIEMPLRDHSKMPEKVDIQNDYHKNPVESEGSQIASSLTTGKSEGNLRDKPEDTVHLKSTETKCKSEI